MSSFRHSFPRIYEHLILPLVDSLQVFLETNQGQAARGDAISHAVRWAHCKSTNKTLLNVRNIHFRYPHQTKEEHTRSCDPRALKGPQSTHYPATQLRRAIRTTDVQAILESCICCHRDRRGVHRAKNTFRPTSLVPEVSCGCRPFRFHDRGDVLLTQRATGFGSTLRPPRCTRDEGYPGFISDITQTTSYCWLSANSRTIRV